MLAPLAATLLTLASSDVVPNQQMVAEARSYFEGEKRGTAAFMFAGTSALLGSAFLGFGNSEVGHGAAVPLAVLGLGQIIVGGIVFFRTDRQLARLSEQIRSDPSTYIAEEGPRIDRVEFMFGIYKVIELALVAVGGGLAAFGTLADEPWVEGLGYGLAIEATLVFIGDNLAEARAEDYAAAIRGFSLAIGQAQDNRGEPVETVGLALRF